MAGQTSEAVLCGQGRRTVRHKGEFSIGNRNKQWIGGIKCRRGHCLLSWLVKQWLNNKNISKKFYLSVQCIGPNSEKCPKTHGCWSLSKCWGAVFSKVEGTCLSAVLRRRRWWSKRWDYFPWGSRTFIHFSPSFSTACLFSLSTDLNSSVLAITGLTVPRFVLPRHCHLWS